MVMTARREGANFILVDVDAFGNEIVTERIFTEEGMEQTTFFRKGGVKAVRKFKKVSKWYRSSNTIIELLIYVRVKKINYIFKMSQL